MSPILKFSLLLLPILCAGCSAGHDYWANRLDDAKDVVSFTAGLGFGPKVQAGPFQVDFYNYAPLYGLRSGELLPGLREHSGNYHVDEGNIGVPLLFANTEIFYPGEHAAARGKAYCALTPLLPVLILMPDEHSRGYCNSCSWKMRTARRRAGREKFSKLPPEEQKKYPAKWVPLTEEEIKKLEGSNPLQLPFDGWRAWYRYTEIGVTAAVAGGLSFSVNPGEFLDLLAGFAGLDIFRDDL